MVNQKIWDKLVWPYMKELAELVAAKGKIPIMHLDASWDRDIERFKELPAKTIILNTDAMTDLRRAKKLLGDHAAFMGDVPVQMLAISSKEEVADYTKRLIDDVGAAGLFLCPGCDAPATAKFENMAAIYETAQKYQ
jgi:uroporphyrinogen-III decarboxylase